MAFFRVAPADPTGGQISYRLVYSANGWHWYHYVFASGGCQLYINDELVDSVEGETGQVDESGQAQLRLEKSGTYTSE